MLEPNVTLGSILIRMSIRTWKVGDLGKITGLSIRTLHYYEEFGLLIPSGRTESGHRVYGEKDLVRLQQILSLKQLGFSLDDIKSCLNERKMVPIQIVKAHKKRIEEEKVRIEKLHGLLSSLEKALSAREKISIDEVIKTMKAISMYEKYFTKEQLEKLSKIKKDLGDKKIKSIQSQWPKLIKAVRAKMTSEADPNDPKVQKLAKKWKELSNSTTGGDVKLNLAFSEMYKNNPSAPLYKKAGIDSKLADYVGKMLYCFYANNLKW